MYNGNFVFQLSIVRERDGEIDREGEGGREKERERERESVCVSSQRYV